MYIHIYVHTYMYIRMCMYTYIYVYTCMYVYTYIRIYMCVYIYIIRFMYFFIVYQKPSKRLGLCSSGSVGTDPQALFLQPHLATYVQRNQ